MKSADTAIESAFIKGETRINLLEIGAPDHLGDQFPGPQKLRIKLEVDTDPPPGAEYAVETLLMPIPFQVRLYSPPCLFAGKLHAILCRTWKNRVKGRDYYDFVWYLGRGIPCHLSHLQARLRQSGHLGADVELTDGSLRQRLQSHFQKIDFEQAKADVRPFIKDQAELALWSSEFFVGLVDRLRTH